MAYLENLVDWFLDSIFDIGLKVDVGTISQINVKKKMSQPNSSYLTVFGKKSSNGK
jgi:hypothetical protein